MSASEPGACTDPSLVSVNVLQVFDPFNSTASGATMNRVNSREKREQEELIKAPCALKLLADGAGSGRMIEMSGDRHRGREGHGDRREERKSGRKELPSTF